MQWPATEVALSAHVNMGQQDGLATKAEMHAGHRCCVACIESPAAHDSSRLSTDSVRSPVRLP